MKNKKVIDLDYAGCTSKRMNREIDDQALLGTISVWAINSKKYYEECFIVYPRGKDGWWTISMYEPKYLSIGINPMTQEEKEELMKILNNGLWEQMIEGIEDICKEGCGKQRFYCYRHVHRKPFPKTPPDYMQL